jgi:hypothetical protein
MSALSRFMSTARAVLDGQDRKAEPKAQPPFFVRTTWLFAELEELAMPEEVETFMAIKVARLHGDIAGASRLVDQIAANSEPLTDGRQRHERNQLCAWIKEQIEREGKS